ncbi:hypothetical protein B1400_0024 [Bifidobacterium italicum]|uniref:BPL/LPL catalytic domain-containing protein n=1 Tax=Bifidobacterium italicum TaxID=1960968 RepID=A0A2A2EN42_9BIFI|nr:lipoate--protein ligase family protein [Bifidobacterium italicum]PAU70220.1 hypothetical protein B1400_0024 [Bifidobacterium italicum]
MTGRSGSVKVPGGKLVRVTLAAGACLDGDFFADGDAHGVIDAVENVLVDAARELDMTLADAASADGAATRPDGQGGGPAHDAASADGGAMAGVAAPDDGSVPTADTADDVDSVDSDLRTRADETHAEEDDGDLRDAGPRTRATENAQPAAFGRPRGPAGPRTRATENAVEAWYRRTVRRIDDVLGGRLIGANADAIALATLRAAAGDDAAARAFEERHTARVRRSWRAAQHPRTPSPICIAADEIRSRWAALRPHVVVDRPRMPEEQMALEPQWARQVADGERPPTIRIWHWAAPAVVCGRYQSIEDEVDVAAARARGVHIVRRGTGGGAMFIEPADTITYSLYAPLWFADGLDAVQAYQLCDAWLLAALAECGVRACYAGLNDIAAVHDDGGGATAVGGKIGGAAQMRVSARDGAPGCLLHHVTLAYAIDAAAMGGILITDPEKMSDKAVKSARRRVEPMTAQTTMTREEVVATMAQVAAAFGSQTPMRA